MVDCCPGGTQTPCDSGADPTGQGIRSITCCATAPSTIPVLIAADSRDTHLAQATAGHGDGKTAIAAADWPLPVVDDLSSVSETPILHAVYAGAEIYLRTGRLRL